MLLKNIVSVGEDISYRDVLSDDFFSSYPYTSDNSAFLSSLKKYHKINNRSDTKEVIKIKSKRKGSDQHENKNSYNSSVIP